MLALSALSLTLAACSPASSSPPVAESSSASTSGSGAASSPAPGGGRFKEGPELEKASDAWYLEMARCVRGEGLDVEDPEPGEGLTADGPAAREARLACRKELGDPPVRLLTAADEAELTQIALKEAACLRKLGYDVPDPGPDEALTLDPEATDADIATSDAQAEGE